MLTTQASFVLAASFAVMASGIIAKNYPMGLLGLTVLLWFAFCWLRFVVFEWQANRFLKSLQRSIDGSSEALVTMVTERDYEVELTANLSSVGRGGRVTLSDVVPDTMQVEGKQAVVINSRVANGLFNWGTSKTLRHTFRIRTPICGRVELPGVQVELADEFGFFRRDRFVPISQTTTVLPYLIRPQTTVSVLKHNNLQRHLGHHRHRSSGISSELHGIRDYRPGDPPRTIAWKPTARLGKLMTCEFENEVPIRATLMVDLYYYQFEGRPGPTAGDRAISTAASIAKLLLADRDPVAAVLMQDHGMHRINHGGGERQLSKLLQHLLSCSNPHPPLSHFYTRDLLQVVFENASRRFPELFDEAYNYGNTPFRLLRFQIAAADRIRRAVAVVIEHLFELPPLSHMQMQYDDVYLRAALVEYVRKYNVVSTATTVALDPPYRDMGHWLRARNNATLAMCEHMTQLRARAKDNELLVIIAPEPQDLLSCEMVESAVKQFVAVGHRVMFIAPEKPLIGSFVSDPQAAEIFEKYRMSGHRKAESLLSDRLSVIGASFARIDDPRLMQLVATEIGLLQSASSRAKPSRRIYV